jgi:hypothetical protein
MDGGEEIRIRIEEAARARRERDGLQRRLDAATRHAEEAAARVRELRSRLDDEQEDVDRLESLSWTRIWASLKGSRAGDVERETAERDAARYAVAEAESRSELASRDVESLAAQLHALGDVDADYADALTAKQEWVSTHDPGAAAELLSIAEERGRLVAEDRETHEAHAAGLTAWDLLEHAQQLLGSARSWSTWDAFGGGGLVTDLVKYDKLDRVAHVLRQADVALGRFSRELDDVGLAAVEGVQVDGLTKAFDVFFDNIFSDLAVRSRIQDASRRVEQTILAVGEVLHRLAGRGEQIAARLRDLEEQRQRILVDG